MNNQKLARSFFERDTRIVAQELLGRVLHFKGQRVLINETEAYAGFDDPASHAYRGKTPRTQVMFGPAGFSYVYLIYGMYHCLNIVTEHEGFPAAVLIRGGWVLDDQAQLGVNLNGPGKLCRYLNISKEDNAIDLIGAHDFFVEAPRARDFNYIATPRIGVKLGLDKYWRFVVSG